MEHLLFLHVTPFLADFCKDLLKSDFLQTQAGTMLFGLVLEHACGSLIERKHWLELYWLDFLYVQLGVSAEDGLISRN